ncbi:MAG: hypothetical protein E7625_07085 [Ruminococcaceae bacterium]|nr:hypothetical protein [Oscillospiraceae bacterium]
MSWDEFYKAIQEAYHIEDEITVIKIPFENIIETTSQELIFKNDYGKTEKINLDECAKNFDLAQGISPEQREGRLKCIGGRCFPFFEFFTPTHHTRFYITLKKTAFTRFLKKIGWNPYAKERSEFYAFQKKLNALGFTSLDLK